MTQPYSTQLLKTTVKKVLDFKTPLKWWNIENERSQELQNVTLLNAVDY